MIDRFTRWPEAIPISNITAETCARTFYDCWIARFGDPERITTDRGTQFESELFRNLTALTGSYKTITTAYHPQCNGLVERFHRQLKASLMCHDTTWTLSLPIVLLGIRTTIKELVYGTNLRIPSDLIDKPANLELTPPQDFVKNTKAHRVTGIMTVTSQKHSTK